VSLNEQWTSTVINEKKTRRTKTAKIKKVDITFAAHCHDFNVLRQFFFDFLLF